MNKTKHQDKHQFTSCHFTTELLVRNLVAGEPAREGGDLTRTVCEVFELLPVGVWSIDAWTRFAKFNELSAWLKDASKPLALLRPRNSVTFAKNLNFSD